MQQHNVVFLATVLALFFWSLATPVSGSVTQVGTLTPFTPLEVPSGDSTYGAVISPDGKHVYGLNSGVANGNNSISQFSRDPTTGELTPLTPFQVPAIVFFMGVFDSTGAFLYLPDHENVTIFSRNETTGQLTFVGSVLRNHTLPGIGAFGNIWASLSPDDTTLYVSGSGAIGVYSRNFVDGGLTLIQEVVGTTVWAGSAISPDGKFFYVASLFDEDYYYYYYYYNGYGIGNLTAIYQFEILPNHMLAPLNPAYVEGCNSSYTVVVSPDGLNLYVSCAALVSGDPVIREYSISATGGLTYVRSYPSCFGGLMIAMPSDGASLYQNCYFNNTIAQFYRNVTTGELSELTPFLVVAGDAPTFGIVFSPDNSYLYVSNSAAGPAGGDGNGTIALYSRVAPSSSNSPTPSSSLIQPSPSGHAGTTGRKRSSTTGRRSTTGRTPTTTGRTPATTGTTGISDAWRTVVSLATVLSTVVGFCLAVTF